MAPTDLLYSVTNFKYLFSMNAFLFSRIVLQLTQTNVLTNKDCYYYLIIMLID